MNKFKIIEVLVFSLINNTTVTLYLRALATEYIFSFDQIKEVEMDGACGTYGGEEKFI
jgi:hypothetical protein